MQSVIYETHQDTNRLEKYVKKNPVVIKNPVVTILCHSFFLGHQILVDG